MTSRKLDDDEVRQFLAELTDLTQRYAIEIVGCGCCGSPWLERAEHTIAAHYDVKGGEYEHLAWLAPGDWDSLESERL